MLLNIATFPCPLTSVFLLCPYHILHNILDIDNLHIYYAYYLLIFSPWPLSSPAPVSPPATHQTMALFCLKSAGSHCQKRGAQSLLLNERVNKRVNGQTNPLSVSLADVIYFVQTLCDLNPVSEPQLS